MQSWRNTERVAGLFSGRFLSKCPFFSKTYRGSIKTHLQVFALFFNVLAMWDF
jgi:hypothetical protein